MRQIKKLTDKNGQVTYPVTHLKAVRDDDGNNAETILSQWKAEIDSAITDIEQEAAQIPDFPHVPVSTRPSDPESNTVYLIPSQDGSSYTEELYKDGSWHVLATHDSPMRIDEVPTPGSKNFVESGGVHKLFVDGQMRDAQRFEGFNYALLALNTNDTYVTSSSNNIQHAVIPVTAGEEFVIENYNSTYNNTRYALATSDSASAGESVPLIAGTHVVVVPKSTSAYVKIPEGCSYLIVNVGKTEDSQYCNTKVYILGGINLLTSRGAGTTLIGSTRYVFYQGKFIGGHTYRITVKAEDWPVSESSYDKFNIYFKNIDNPESTTIKLLPSAVQRDEAFADYYDITIPDKVTIAGVEYPAINWQARLYGRANTNSAVKVRYVDITLDKIYEHVDTADEEINEQIEDIKADVRKIIPTTIKFKDLSKYELVSQFNGKLLYTNNIYGKSISQISTYTQSGAKTYKIPLAGDIDYIDVYTPTTTSNNIGSIFFNSNNIAVYGFICGNSDKHNLSRWTRHYITGNMSCLLLSTMPSQETSDNNCLVIHYKNEETTPADILVGTKLVINNETYDRTAGVGVLSYMGISFDATTYLTFSVGQNFLDVVAKLTMQASSDSLFVSYMVMEVSDYNSIAIDGIQSGTKPGGIFVDGNMNIVGVVLNGTIDNPVNVPGGSKYFIYATVNATTERFDLIAVANGVKKDISENTKRIEELEVGGSSSSDFVTFRQGSIDTSGNTTESDDFVISSFIAGGRGFFLMLNAGYEVYQAHLFDKKGNLIAYNYLPPKTYFSSPYYPVRNDTVERRFYGTCSIPAGYYMKVVVCKYINNDYNTRVAISPNEDIINDFCYLNDGRLHSIGSDILKEDYPNYSDDEIKNIMNQAQSKIKNLACAAWTPLKYITPTAANSDWATSKLFFYKEGRTRIGIPYSGPDEYTKIVGQYVSVYTFLTSIKNPRSVMYTEMTSNGNYSISEYGIEYHGGGLVFNTAYYGTVCTGLTSYVGNFKNLFVSGMWMNGNMSAYLTEIINASAANVKPLDFIWNEGHCSVIADIICDEHGNRKFILWAEQTKPSVYITPYTVAMFEKRLEKSSCRVYRKKSWENLEPAEYAPFVQSDWIDYPSDIKYNEDICTMYGDKPCLAVGSVNGTLFRDILYLNYNKTKGYSSIVVEKRQGINSITTYYLTSSQSSGITVETEGWSTSYPSFTTTNKYLWKKSVITYDDDSAITIVKRIYTKESNVAISEIVNHYLTTGKSTDILRSSAGWTTASNELSEKEYLWIYETITTGNTTVDTPAYLSSFDKIGLSWISVHTATLEDNSNIVEQDGDWNDFNLNDEMSNNPLTAGIYRAKMTGDGIESDCTQWELIDVNLQVVDNTDSVEVTLSRNTSSNGIPYLIRQEAINGTQLSGKHYEITAEDISGDDVVKTFSWAKSTTVNNSQIKLLVQGEFGVAMARYNRDTNSIQLPSRIISTPSIVDGDAGV